MRILRSGQGGLWRQPPNGRAPLPRFSVLIQSDRDAIAERILVPGGPLVMGTNPLLASRIFASVELSKFEKRGEIVRIFRALRGGDRPKNSESEFPDFSVIPRSQFEPWGLFRRRAAGTVADNHRIYGAGGLRRVSDTLPFSDVIESAPAGRREKALAPHPSLKPQRFVRAIVRAAMPMGGIILYPFAGSGRRTRW